MAGRRKGPRTPGVTVFFEHTEDASIRVAHPYAGGQVFATKRRGEPLRVFSSNIEAPGRLVRYVEAYARTIAREYGA